MNKEKTALTQLIENIDARLANDASDTLRYSLETCRNEAVSLLQKEQEQIEKAYESGFEDGGSDGAFGVTPKIYYLKKYGGER